MVMAKLETLLKEIVRLRNMDVNFDNFHANGYFAINVIREASERCKYKYVGKSGDVTLNFYNKLQKLYKKQMKVNEPTKKIVDTLHSNTLDMSDLEMGVWYVDYCVITNELFAGTGGVSRDVKIQYDADFSLDENLSSLYDAIVESECK